MNIDNMLKNVLGKNKSPKMDFFSKNTTPKIKEDEKSKSKYLFYHGTTQQNLPNILKEGLKPHKPKSVFGKDSENDPTAIYTFRGYNQREGGYPFLKILLKTITPGETEYINEQEKYYKKQKLKDKLVDVFKYNIKKEKKINNIKEMKQDIINSLKEQKQLPYTTPEKIKELDEDIIQINKEFNDKIFKIKNDDDTLFNKKDYILTDEDMQTLNEPPFFMEPTKKDGKILEISLSEDEYKRMRLPKSYGARHEVPLSENIPPNRIKVIGDIKKNFGSTDIKFTDPKYIRRLHNVEKREKLLSNYNEIDDKLEDLPLDKEEKYKIAELYVNKDKRKEEENISKGLQLLTKDEAKKDMRFVKIDRVSNNIRKTIPHWLFNQITDPEKLKLAEHLYFVEERKSTDIAKMFNVEIPNHVVVKPPVMWTKEQKIAGLQMLADKLNRTPKLKDLPQNYPTKNSFATNFGSWNNALIEAGFNINRQKMATIKNKNMSEKELDKQYREENRDKISEQNKQYREENRDKISEWHRQKYKNNTDEILNRSKQYYNKNKDKIINRIRNYYIENKDKISETKRKYADEHKDEIKKRHKLWYEQKKKDETFVGPPKPDNLNNENNKEEIKEDEEVEYKIY
jgi:hypothetical protein